MDIKCYLALTGMEYAATSTPPTNLAWMACHFSPCGNGLSNLPQQLPEGSLVMVDDSIPILEHDPMLIAAQLNRLVRELSIRGIILDLQRADMPKNADLAEALVRQLNCPVCVSALYAGPLDCPVFLPPPPLHQHLQEHITPWQGREIWLEATLEAEQITVTETGSTVVPVPFSAPSQRSFDDVALCCRYKIQVLEDRAIFTLVRDEQMLKKLLEQAEKLGIRYAVGLYQQLGQQL